MEIQVQINKNKKKIESKPKSISKKKKAEQNFGDDDDDDDDDDSLFTSTIKRKTNSEKKNSQEEAEEDGENDEEDGLFLSDFMDRPSSSSSSSENENEEVERGKEQQKKSIAVAAARKKNEKLPKKRSGVEEINEAYKENEFGISSTTTMLAEEANRSSAKITISDLMKSLGQAIPEKLPKDKKAAEDKDQDQDEDEDDKEEETEEELEDDENDADDENVEEKPKDEGEGKKNKLIARNIEKQLIKIEKKAKSVGIIQEDTVQKQRAEREAAYNIVKKEMNGWEKASRVLKSRPRVFPLPSRNQPALQTNPEAGIFSIVPTNELEKQVAAALSSIGISDQPHNDLLELPENPRITLERARALAKQRSDLFHQEMKLKKAARVKSKAFVYMGRKSNNTYILPILNLINPPPPPPPPIPLRSIISQRKLKKKEKERLEAQREAMDPEYAKEKEAKREAERAMERVTLKRKNTRDWVRQTLAASHGKLDENSRQAVAESMRKMENLRKAMSEKSKEELSDEEDEIAERIAAGDASALEEVRFNTSLKFLNGLR